MVSVASAASAAAAHRAQNSGGIRHHRGIWRISGGASANSGIITASAAAANQRRENGEISGSSAKHHCGGISPARGAALA